jgi:hypothetical protein
VWGVTLFLTFSSMAADDILWYTRLWRKLERDFFKAADLVALCSGVKKPSPRYGGRYNNSSTAADDNG